MDLSAVTRVDTLKELTLEVTAGTDLSPIGWMDNLTKLTIICEDYHDLDLSPIGRLNLTELCLLTKSV